MASLSCGCRTEADKANAELGVTQLSTAQFSYTTFDRNGSILTKGSLILPWPPPKDQKFYGTWQARFAGPIGEEDRIGPQVGGGKCLGSFDGSTLRLALNPDVHDDNVTISCKVQSPTPGSLQGKWTSFSSAGEAGGNFEAKR
jgi:hypothetical protein